MENKNLNNPLVPVIDLEWEPGNDNVIAPMDLLFWVCGGKCDVCARPPDDCGC